MGEKYVSAVWHLRGCHVEEFPMHIQTQTTRNLLSARRVICCQGSTILVLDSSKGSIIRRLTGHTNDVTQVCLRKSNQLQLLSCSLDGTGWRSLATSVCNTNSSTFISYAMFLRSFHVCCSASLGLRRWQVLGYLELGRQSL